LSFSARVLLYVQNICPPLVPFFFFSFAPPLEGCNSAICNARSFSVLWHRLFPGERPRPYSGFANKTSMYFWSRLFLLGFFVDYTPFCRCQKSHGLDNRISFLFLLQLGTKWPQPCWGHLFLMLALRVFSCVCELFPGR